MGVLLLVDAERTTSSRCRRSRSRAVARRASRRSAPAARCQCARRARRPSSCRMRLRARRVGARVEDVIDRTAPAAVVAPGTNRGNEVLAHVAARRDLPFAANCTAVATATLDVTRVRWGGSLLEEARIHAPLPLLSVAPHVGRRPPPTAPGAPEVETFTPALDDADLVVQVAEHVEDVSTGVSLAEAKVVVSGGRGVGSADGFGILEELAGLLDAAVGCSRVVTSAGWRPHTDQVGQTGTKVSPDLYIACGISGATQHIAGCKGAKKILAINSDAEAPILASADYAVIGDLTEIVPAITAELQKGALRIDVVAGALALAAALAVAGALFARRAKLLVGPRPARQAGRALRRRAAPRAQRGGDRARPAQAVPAPRPGADARGDLLGLPRPLPDDRDGDDRRRRPRRDAARGSGTRAGSRCSSTSSPCSCWPAWSPPFAIRKVQRPARFEGSHLGEADLILAMIAGIVTTLLLWHASRIALGLNEWPASWSPVSDALSGLFGDGVGDRGARARLRLGARADHPLFLAYLPHSKHLHIATAAINVFFGRTRARGRLEPLRFDGPDEEMRFGAGTVRGPHLEADDRHVLLHRVRALPGRLPGLDHRQGAVAEAADHGPARPGLRGGPAAAARRRGLRAAAARAERGDRRRGLGLRDLRRLRARVPGVDRARRPHRRPAPPPGDDRLALPGARPSRCCATSSAPRTRGASRRPSARTGPSALGVRVLEPGEPGAGGPLLGRLRGVVRRARAHRGGVDGASCSRPRASTSRSSARASRAPATRRGGWATSTCSRRTPSRTWRRSTRRA